MAAKNIIYVGGLENEVTEEILHAAFIPFGEIRSVQIPKDFVANKSRGFGFVEFELEEDATDAMENMEGSELFGKVLKCRIAKPQTKLEKGKAIWSAEEWLQNNLKEKNELEEMGEGDDFQIASMTPEL